MLSFLLKGKKGILIFFFALIPLFSAAPDFYPADRLQYGDILFAKTRVENNQMHTFRLRVISFMKAGPDLYPSVIAVTEDPYISNIGIAAGMSGSPVYYEDKLVGAIAFTWENLKKPVLGITPIGEMLPIIDYQGLEPEDGYALSPTRGGQDDLGRVAGYRDWSDFWKRASMRELSARVGPEFRRYLEEESIKQKASLPHAPLAPLDLEEVIAGLDSPSPVKDAPLEAAEVFPVSIAFSGPWNKNHQPGMKDSPSWDLFKREVLPGFTAAPVFTSLPAGGGEEVPASPLVPGDYIGVNLARGEIELSIFGTVTYIEGDTLLAFGHSMGGRGAIRLPLYQAYTDMIMPLQTLPFKVGRLLREIGSVEQDRATGILGKIGGKATYLPIHVSLDTPLRKESYDFEVVNDKEFSPFVTGFVINELFFSEESSGRPALLSYTLRADYQSSGESRSLTLSNRIDLNNNVDGIAYLSSQVTQVLGLIRDNEWETGKVTKLTVEISSRPRYGFMKAVAVKMPKTVYHPGEEIRFQLGFDRFRQPRVYREFTYRIPPEAKEGNYQLAITPAVDRWLLEVVTAAKKYPLTSLSGITEFLESRPPFHRLSVWSWGERESVWVKERVYRRLPVNQKKLLLGSLHNEKERFLEIQYQDYDMEETPSGFLTLPYRVQANYKD